MDVHCKMGCTLYGSKKYFYSGCTSGCSQFINIFPWHSIQFLSQWLFSPSNVHVQDMKEGGYNIGIARGRRTQQEMWSGIEQPPPPRLTLCLWIDYCLGFHPLDPYTSKKSAAVASIFFSQPNITQRFSHSRRYNLCLHTSFVCAVDRLMSRRFDLTVCFSYLSSTNKDAQMNILFSKFFKVNSFILNIMSLSV